MKKPRIDIYFLFIVVILCSAPCHAYSPAIDWRFGFEYNEIGAWSQPHHEQLLTKLEQLATQGGINVNGTGSWSSMQSDPAFPINFNETDATVRLFQKHGFSLIWYLRCDAAWAFPTKKIPLAGTAAPDSAFEDDWENYVKAIVERYDGDGFQDMPGLTKPIQFYVMIGEIRFGKTGKGDAETGPFWFDTIDNLLRLHRLTYTAVHGTDPSGFSRVVSSGALLFDLYADFPDYPQFDSNNSQSTLRQRLAGKNYHNAVYTAGWDSLKKMLKSFGDDADGVECDYVGWHPHFNWRVIDQEFALIHAFAGAKPVFVDDMWCNLFAQGYAAGALIPGEAQFTASPWPKLGTDWVQAISGDFPNQLFTSLDPYAELFQKLNSADEKILNWYYTAGSHRLIKSFVSAFGEGAERACYSGTNDLLRGYEGGWINLLGTRQEGYAEKPQYYTFKFMVEKLLDFSTVSELSVSPAPRTRVYKFERPRGPVFVLWSETGPAPSDMDYRVATGETVTIHTGSNRAILTHSAKYSAFADPKCDTLKSVDGKYDVQLGYEPIYLEPIQSVGVRPQRDQHPEEFILSQNFPNPFNASTVIAFSPKELSVVSISIYDDLGRCVYELPAQNLTAGKYQFVWEGIDPSGRRLPSGVYILEAKIQVLNQRVQPVKIKKMLLLR